MSCEFYEAGLRVLPTNYFSFLQKTWPEILQTTHFWQNEPSISLEALLSFPECLVITAGVGVFFGVVIYFRGGSGHLRVDNQIANGCSAAAEFTGSLSALCVCCTECTKHILKLSFTWGLTQVSAISRKTFITLASPVRFCRRKKKNVWTRIEARMFSQIFLTI